MKVNNPQPMTIVSHYYADGNPFPRNPDGSLKTVDSPTFQESWAEMEKSLSTGKVRAIGVSNFSIKTWGNLLSVYCSLSSPRCFSLEKLFETAKIVPAVNQVEYAISKVSSCTLYWYFCRLHPYLVQNDLVEYCKERGIVPVAYTPTGI